MTITVEYKNYTNIPASLITNVEQVVAAASEITLPEGITLMIHNEKSSDHRKKGMYTHTGIITRDGREVVKSRCAHVYAKGMDRAMFQHVIAHELAHAEHFTLYPESRGWATDRQEDYANKGAERIGFREP